MAAFDNLRTHAGGNRTAESRVSLRGVAVLALAGVMVAGAALLPVVQSSKATTTGYEIRRLEAQKADLQAALYNAQTDIAGLGSLARIDREARERLGMVAPSRSVVVQVAEPAPAERQVPARYLPPPLEATPPAAEEGGVRDFLARLFGR